MGQAPEATEAAPSIGVVPHETTSERRQGKIRAFCCPKVPNLHKLIKPGVVNRVPDRDSPTGYKEWGRDGDIWIKFTNGYWTGGLGDDDPIRIAWCEEEAAAENPSVKDMEDPQAKVWYELVRGQQITGRRDPTVPRTVNVARALRGEEMLGLGTDDFDTVLKTVEDANQAR